MSVEFEYVILNKLCNSGEYFNKAVPVLAYTHFENIGNQEIFKMLKEYFKKYKDNPSFTEIIAMTRNVANAEIREAIKQSLISSRLAAESKSIDFMLDQTVMFVKDSLYLEALRVGSEGLMKCDEELKKKAEKIMDDRAKITIDTDLGLDFDDIQRMVDYYQERSIGILSQHKELNKRLGTGFLPGTISLIMAASGIGKSLLMTDLISGNIKDNKNVLLVSLEMGDMEIMKRVHANVFNLPINSLNDCALTDEEKTLIKSEDIAHEFVSKENIIDAYDKLKAQGETGKLYIKDYPSGTFSALNLIALVESYKMELGIEFDMVYIDYVGIAKSDLVTQSVGLYSYVKSIVEEFRSAARVLKLPIISANQLNRGAVNKDDADNSTVSDSMGAVMTADFIMFLLQNEEMKLRNEIGCKVTKNRFNGRTDHWIMNIDYTRMRFKDGVLQDNNTPDPTKGQEPITMNDIESDFDIVSSAQMVEYDKFCESEVKDIINTGFEIMNREENAPFEVDESEISDPIMDMMNSLE